ncbi:unnamed protein product [Mycena citricolor]|uniref:AB hydrolase-1 domain-containing protein n=1 Tax=Mycena citricolor TaxID=2018698 RepID=A0AAD2HJ80_9AGAR|nr:unnamed protein product [Mycena citricolor]CAK5276229.1 unnamed protein product [Mycena citricolor]
MPSFNLPSGIVFSYTDSGIPTSNKTNYVTLVLIHGIMFNNGTFQSLAALGPSNGVRVIAPNRREYDGFTPHPDELDLLMNGSEAEKEAFIEDMGRDLALLIAGLGESLSLPGGVAVAGWSLGSLAIIAIVASMESLPEGARRTLSSSVRSVILYREFHFPRSDKADSLQSRPPSSLVFQTRKGCTCPRPIPKCLEPRWDRSLPVGRRASSCTATSRPLDLRNLSYSRTDPNRPPTIETIPMDGIIDLTAGAKADAMLVSPSFAAATAKLAGKALFDTHVRGQLWKDSKFYLVTGSTDGWNSIYAGWKIEERMLAEAKPECEITFELVDGANHFFVMEEPQRALDCFKQWFGN